MDMEMETAIVKGKRVTIVPGIRFEDAKVYECARKWGWIMNYATLFDLVDDDNYACDWKLANLLRSIQHY